MIINTTSRISPGLLQTPPSQLNKTATRAKAQSPPAAISESETAASQAALAAQNIASVVSPIQDAQAARAAIQAARQQFMAQPNLAMLAQANQLPQNALRLLQ
jgi:flagellin